jgi:hypothetical protein
METGETWGVYNGYRFVNNYFIFTNESSLPTQDDEFIFTIMSNSKTIKIPIQLIKTDLMDIYVYCNSFGNCNEIVNKNC